MQPFGELSEKAREKVSKLAWPKGAWLYCGQCLKGANKTREQMDKYLKKWPNCPNCGIPAQVKPL